MGVSIKPSKWVCLGANSKSVRTNWSKSGRSVATWNIRDVSYGFVYLTFLRAPLNQQINYDNQVARTRATWQKDKRMTPVWAATSNSYVSLMVGMFDDTLTRYREKHSREKRSTTFTTTSEPPGLWHNKSRCAAPSLLAANLRCPSPRGQMSDGLEEKVQSSRLLPELRQINISGCLQRHGLRHESMHRWLHKWTFIIISSTAYTRVVSHRGSGSFTGVTSPTRPETCIFSSTEIDTWENGTREG